MVAVEENRGKQLLHDLYLFSKWLKDRGLELEDGLINSYLNELEDSMGGNWSKYPIKKG